MADACKLARQIATGHFQFLGNIGAGHAELVGNGLACISEGFGYVGTGRGQAINQIGAAVGQNVDHCLAGMARAMVICSPFSAKESVTREPASDTLLDMDSLVVFSSSDKLVCAPEMEARTRSELVTMASRCVISSSIKERMRSSFSV